MSYEHGTIHYNLPQTVGTDTRDWFDTNEAFADIDAAIYSAGQTAETAAQDLDGVKSDVQGLKDADIAMTGRVDGIEGRVGASEQAITRLQQDVADVDTDLKDSICAIEEASATAAYAHATGEFFWYNDTLYKATQNIAVGQQIVPDTNCSTTNITTELLNGGQGGVEIDDSSVSVSKVWSSSKTNTELNTKAPSADVYTKAQVYTKSEIDALLAQIGGGMTKDFDNAVVINTSAGVISYTVPKNGAILCCVGASSSKCVIQADGTSFYTASASGTARFGFGVLEGVSAGTVITSTGSIHAADGGDNFVIFVPYK